MADAHETHIIPSKITLSTLGLVSKSSLAFSDLKKNWYARIVINHGRIFPSLSLAVWLCGAGRLTGGGQPVTCIISQRHTCKAHNAPTKLAIFLDPHFFLQFWVLWRAWPRPSIPDFSMSVVSNPTGFFFALLRYALIDISTCLVCFYLLIYKYSR